MRGHVYGSVDVIVWAWSQVDMVDPYELLLLLAFSEALQFDAGWISAVSWLAAKTGIPRPWVQTRLSRLVDIGLVDIDPETGAVRPDLAAYEEAEA